MSVIDEVSDIEEVSIIDEESGIDEVSVIDDALGIDEVSVIDRVSLDNLSSPVCIQFEKVSINLGSSFFSLL